jgi:hypothetical protein
MFRWKAAEGEYRLNKTLAKSKYSYTFYTAIAPLLMLISLLTGPIDRSGGLVAFFSQHWIFGPLALIPLIGLSIISIAGIREGRSFSKKAADILREQ